MNSGDSPRFGPEALYGSVPNFSMHPDPPLTPPEDYRPAGNTDVDAAIADQAAVDGDGHVLSEQRAANNLPQPPYEVVRVAPRTRRGASLPAPVQPTSEIAEAKPQPKPRTVVVEALEEVTAATPDEPNVSERALAARRPDARVLAGALRAGRTVVRTFSWIGGRARVDATPEMVPPNAVTHEAESGSDTPGTEARFKYARLKARLGTPPAGEQSGQQQPGGAQLDQIVERHRNVDFKVGIVARGVPQREHEERIYDAAIQVSNASKSGLNPAATATQAQGAEELKVLLEGRTEGLGRETIVVGADPVHLEQVAETAAAAFSSRRTLAYEVERNADHSVRCFSDMETAASPATGGGQMLVTGEDLADRAVLPEEALVGLGRVSAPTNFDVNHTIPDGVPKITFGVKLDNRGRPTGRPMEITREHTAIFAQTESGKSVLLRAIGVDIQRQNFARRQAAEAAGESSYDHEAVVYIDCKKEHNFTHILSRQIGGARTASGQQMPEDMATVHHIAFGGDGPGVRFNLLKAAGNTPKEWRQRIDTAVQIMSSKYLSKGAEVHGAVKKHLGKALDAAMRMYGINPATGRSKFPYASPPLGTPATPTGEFTAGLVEQAAHDSGLKGEYFHNVVGWAQDEIHELFRGDNGAPLAQNGYDFDAMATLDNEGITSMDLAHVRDAGARQITTLAALYDLYDACVEKNRQEGIIGETAKIRVTVIIDEADIFGNDALGAQLADFFTHARSVGLRIIFAKQGDIEGSLHPQVLVNTNKIMLSTNHEPDQAAFAASAGKTTLQDMKRVSGAPKGMGAYAGRGMERAELFQVDNPDDPAVTPMADRSYVVGPEALIDTTHTIDIFSPSQIAESHSFLQEDPVGLEIRSWAEACAMYLASGRGLADIGDELAATLRPAMQDSAQRAGLRCAITEAVQTSINSRPELQHVETRTQYIRHNLVHMLSIADGHYLEGWDKPRHDLAITVGIYNRAYNPQAPADDDNSWKRFDVPIDGRFAAIKDRLNEQMTAGPHPRTAEFEQILGKPLFGDSADEQLDRVIRLRLDAVGRIADALSTMGVDGQLTAEGRVELYDDIEKVVGGQVARLDEDRIRAQASVVVGNEIVDLKKELSEEQFRMLETVINKIPPERLVKKIGYSSVERSLSEAIEERRAVADALDREEIDALCRFTSAELDGIEEEYEALIACEKAKDQFAIIERKIEQRYVAKTPYVNRVQPNRIFFAFDPLAPGATLDNCLAALQRLQEEDGPIHMARRNKSGEAMTVDYTAGAQLAQGDYSNWKSMLSRHFAYSRNIVPPSIAARRFVVKGLGRVTEKMWSDAAKQRMRASQLARAAQEAASKQGVAV